jgi:CPA2 family monovalent cation:H+ antiporter-2
MHSNTLEQLLILLASSVLVVTLLRRMKLPPIVGYLAVGMLLGPAALRVAGEETTRVMSEYGVVFLVFTLGLEFSFPRMMAMRWQVFGLGGAQVHCVDCSHRAFRRCALTDQHRARRCTGDVFYRHRYQATY